MEDLTDKELICLLIKGRGKEKEHIFDIIYKRHHRTMYLYSLKLLKSSEASSDIVQEVFIKLWECLEYITPDINIKAYLYSMVRNRVINYIRDNRTRLIHNYKIIQENGLTEEIRLIEMYEEEAKRKVVENAMNSLPPQQKMVLQCRFEGKSNVEIAKEHQLSLNTINVHYRLGLKALKGALKILILLFSSIW